jgi:hypothetical protein
MPTITTPQRPITRKRTNRINQRQRACFFCKRIQRIKVAFRKLRSRMRTMERFFERHQKALVALLVVLAYTFFAAEHLAAALHRVFAR